MATKITEHFNYEPFWANSETAKRKKIDNTPVGNAKNNIYQIVREILEPIARRWKGTIGVNSSYRCPKLNEAVGGSKTSQHMTGQAVDIRATSGGNNADLFYLILGMISREEIKVGQMIWEFGTDSCPQWVHISLPYSKTNNIIKAVKGGKYIPFTAMRGLKINTSKNAGWSLKDEWKSAPGAIIDTPQVQTEGQTEVKADGGIVNTNTELMEGSETLEEGMEAGNSGAFKMNLQREKKSLSDKRRVTNKYKKS